MRNYIKCDKIIKKFANSTVNNETKILLTVAISQLIFLKTPAYAVVNTSVEISKKINKINPSFINAILRKIITNQDSKAGDKYLL